MPRLHKHKPNELEALRALLTTDEAVRRAHDVHNLLDTTAGMLSMPRSCGLEPIFVQYGRTVRYRKADLDDWCKKRIAERAQAAKRKLRERNE
jgi:hypothetical protein